MSGLRPVFRRTQRAVLRWRPSLDAGTAVAKTCTILLQRAYEPPRADGSFRVLVDRYWPRGQGRDRLALDEWAKELGASPALIRWYGHEVERWEEFRRRYRHELAGDGPQARLDALLAAAGTRPITLVYGARDEAHNQAVVLREVLLERAGAG